MFNHKTVFRTRNPAFWVVAVIANGFCSPSLQTIVSIDFLCHSRVDCALRFLFFLSVGNYLKTIFLLDWLSKLYYKLLSCVGLCGLIVLANCVIYFTFTFINSVNVTAKGIPAAVTWLFFALISLYFSKFIKLKIAPLKSVLSSLSISITK